MNEWCDHEYESYLTPSYIHGRKKQRLIRNKCVIVVVLSITLRKDDFVNVIYKYIWWKEGFQCIQLIAIYRNPDQYEVNLFDLYKINILI